MRVISCERVKFEQKQGDDGKPVDVSTFKALVKTEGAGVEAEGEGEGDSKESAVKEAEKEAALNLAAKLAR